MSRPPGSTRTNTPFPYTVRFRSEAGRLEHLDIPGPGRLRPLRDRTDEPALDAARVERREQHPRRGRDAAVEAEFADDDIAAQRLRIDHPHRTEQRERDRQVVMRALLGRSEEHTSELQSLMRNSYAVFCLKKKKKDT